MTQRKSPSASFSLVEVVLAIGVISFAIVAILGLMPVGLSTSHSAQDETRTPQIAQSILSSFAGQAQSQFTAVALPLPSPSSVPSLDLSMSNSSVTNPALFLYADNYGNLSTSATNAIYSISVGTNNTPPGFNSNSANQVTIRVVSPPLPNQTAIPTPTQTVRDYTRIISKY